jgi:uncharacterized cupin superfamily protein
MAVQIVINEECVPKTKLEGRDIRWLMTPEKTGGKYTSACTVEFAPGKRALPSHSHPNGEEMVYIVQGCGEVLIGEEIYKINTGSIILFPQGTPHMVYNSGQTVLKAICFYAPASDAINYAYHKEVDFPQFKLKT